MKEEEMDFKRRVFNPKGEKCDQANSPDNYKGNSYGYSQVHVQLIGGEQQKTINSLIRGEQQKTPGKKRKIQYAKVRFTLQLGRYRMHYL